MWEARVHPSRLILCGIGGAIGLIFHPMREEDLYALWKKSYRERDHTKLYFQPWEKLRYQIISYQVENNERRDSNTGIDGKHHLYM